MRGELTQLDSRICEMAEALAGAPPAGRANVMITAARANPAPLSDWQREFLNDIEDRVLDIAARGGDLTEKQWEMLERIAGRIAVADLAHDLAQRTEALAIYLTGSEPTSRAGHELRFGARGSLSIKLTGPGAPCWHDHEAGVGGDALKLVAHLRRCPMPDAIEWAKAWLGSATVAPIVPRAAPAKADPKRSTAPLAQRLWAEAVEPAGTAVERYLASRGLSLPADAPLRFHPDAWRNRENGPHGPAMLARMTDPMTNEPVGVHVTYLRQDGSGKTGGDSAKIMLGNVGVVRLDHDDMVTGGLGIAEGIETSLAVMQRYGWRPVWAATSAGGIARFSVLSGVEALTVFADHDDAGTEAALACRERWQAAGREVAIKAPPRGSDFADMAGRAAA